MKLEGFGVFRERKSHADRKNVVTDPFTGRMRAEGEFKNVVVSDTYLTYKHWWRVRDTHTELPMRFLPNGTRVPQHLVPKEAPDWRMFRFGSSAGVRYWLWENGELTRLFWAGPNQPLMTYGEFNAFILNIYEGEPEEAEGGEASEDSWV